MATIKTMEQTHQQTDIPVRSVNIGVGTLITMSLSLIAVLIAGMGLLYTLIDARIDETNQRIDRVETRIIERLDVIENKIDNQS